MAHKQLKFWTASWLEQSLSWCILSPNGKANLKVSFTKSSKTKLMISGDSSHSWDPREIYFFGNTK